MKQLTALQALCESPIPSSHQQERKAWFKNVQECAARIDSSVHGTKLAKILSDGGFPATEARGLVDKFDKFQDALDDFEMALMIEYDK